MESSQASKFGVAKRWFDDNVPQLLISTGRESEYTINGRDIHKYRNEQNINEECTEKKIDRILI